MKLARLNRFNLIMAALHAVQGLAVVLLSRNFLLPITVSYLRLSPQTQGLVPATQTIAHISLPWLIAIFFFFSAAAHLLIGTVYRTRYETSLTSGLNKARWFEYALSAS